MLKKMLAYNLAVVKDLLSVYGYRGQAFLIVVVGSHFTAEDAENAEKIFLENSKRLSPLKDSSPLRAQRPQRGFYLNDNQVVFGQQLSEQGVPVEAGQAGHCVCCVVVYIYLHGLFFATDLRGIIQIVLKD